MTRRHTKIGLHCLVVSLAGRSVGVTERRLAGRGAFASKASSLTPKNDIVQTAHRDRSHACITHLLHRLRARELHMRGSPASSRQTVCMNACAAGIAGDFMH